MVHALGAKGPQVFLNFLALGIAEDEKDIKGKHMTKHTDMLLRNIYLLNILSI
jgi:hypothetical protein